MGIYLDEKVNFKKHIENKLCKVSEGISVIKNPRHTSRQKIITNYIQSLFEKTY